MSIAQATLLLGALTLLPGVLGHSFIDGVVCRGKYYKGTGYGALSHYDSIGWPAPGNKDSGPVFPRDFDHPDIICNKDARPGPNSAPVKGGETVTTKWGPYPKDHIGPIMCYMAKCPGKCSEAKKEELKWFKTAEEGLIGQNPNRWAVNKFLENGNTWNCTVPDTIAKGEYVMRVELWAIQGAHALDGAQAYPWCINLDVDSQGTDNPEGVVGTKLYTPNDPGVHIQVNKPLQSYPIPGPALYKPGSSPSSPPSDKNSTETAASSGDDGDSSGSSSPNQPAGYETPSKSSSTRSSSSSSRTADAAPTGEGDCSEKTVTVTATVTVTGRPSSSPSPSSTQRSSRPTSSAAHHPHYRR